jgi:hypothetical protein
MGDSVLIPQIRNLKNAADLRRKQNQQRRALETGIKVDNDADVAFKIAAEQVKQNMLPIMPNEEMLRNAERDEIGQYNTALKHLKSIMPGVYAAQVLQEGLLGDAAGIAEFNRFWPGFQKYVANFGNITPNYFREYWQRYRKLLEATDKTGVYTPSEMSSAKPVEQVSSVEPRLREATTSDEPGYKAQASVGPRNRRNLTPFPDTPNVIIPNLPENEKQVVKYFDNPLYEPTTKSLVRSPQIQIKRQKGYRTYSDIPKEAGLPTRVVQTYTSAKNKIKDFVIDFFTEKPKAALTLRGSSTPKEIEEEATKITPILNNLQVDGPTITTLAIAIGAYSLLANDVDIVQTATDFVRENAGRTKQFLLRKAYEIMARAVYGPDVAQGLVAWQNNVALQQGGGPGVHKKGHARIIGYGIAADPDVRYSQFGCYLLHKPSLEKNIINIKFPSLASHPKIPQRVASEELVTFIKKVLEEGQMNAPLYAALSESDKEYFDNLAHMCKVGGKLGISVKKDNEDMKRFEIVRGEILAGNDAPQLIKELKHLTLKLIADGKIPKRSAHDLLYEIAIL